MRIRQITMPQAIVSLGLMALLGFVCWLTHSEDPLLFLFALSMFVLY